MLCFFISDPMRIDLPEIDHSVMAITSAEAILCHTAPTNGSPYRMLRGADCTGEIQMRRISLFAVAAALMATGFGVWAASTTNARVAPSVGEGIEPFQLMINAKGLPSEEIADYTFVFR
jgi:hypothetical protein